MLAQEIHIEFDLAFQNLNSNIRTTFKAEEKDWFYNMSMIRWMKKRLSPRSDVKRIPFQGITKRYEDLEVLIPPPEPLTLFTTSTPNLYQAVLPSTLQHFIDCNVKLLRSCDSEFAAQTLSTISTYVIAFNIRADVGLYSTFTIAIDGIQVFNIANYPGISTGLLSQKQYYYLVNLVIQQLKDSGYEAYWETDGFTPPSYDGNDILQNKIIIKKTTVFNQIVLTDSVGSYFYNSGTQSVQGYTFNGVIGSQINSTRLYDREKLSTLSQNSFSKTHYSKPIIGMQNNLLYVYSDEKFICSSAILHYLRKPRLIDLALNIGSELPTKVVLEIIDEAVSLAAVRTSAENYQQLLAQNLMDE